MSYSIRHKLLIKIIPKKEGQLYSESWTRLFNFVTISPMPLLLWVLQLKITDNWPIWWIFSVKRIDLNADLLDTSLESIGNFSCDAPFIALYIVEQLLRFPGVQSLMLRDRTPARLHWYSTFRYFLHCSIAASMLCSIIYLLWHSDFYYVRFDKRPKSE